MSNKNNDCILLFRNAAAEKTNQADPNVNENQTRPEIGTQVISIN